MLGKLISTYLNTFNVIILFYQYITSIKLFTRPSLTSLQSPLLSPTKDDLGNGPSLDGHDRLSDGEGEEEEGDKLDSSFIPYQPRPAAVCTQS